MVEIIQSSVFRKWFDSLRDMQAKARIRVRLTRLEAGNPGQVRVVAKGVSELKIDYGPGYRVYFTKRGPVVVVLLCGGDKSTQSADIKWAVTIAENWKD